jgi:hypothetical protein
MVNISPSLLLELLQRIARVTKDYLGVLNEDSLRKNFILVYELLDEVIVSTSHYLSSYNNDTTFPDQLFGPLAKSNACLSWNYCGFLGS